MKKSYHIGDSLKIGKEEYIIQNGDYVLFNGDSYMFCSGNNRTLKRIKFDAYNYITLTKKLISEIDFTKTIITTKGKSDMNNELIYYKFISKTE